MGTSHQSGWVMARGKKWYGYYRQRVLDPVTNKQKVKKITLILGLRPGMTKFEAREELQKEIAKRTGQNISGQVMKDGSVTFGWFVRNRYLPLREANWKPETAKVKRIQIQRDLVEKLENVPLDVMDRFMLQMHINHLATLRSKDRVLQARSYLKSIFSEAVEQDFLPKDPSRKVTAPHNLRAKDKTVLTWDQLGLVLASLSAKDLGFFADCAAKKWPLRGSRSHQLSAVSYQPVAAASRALALAGGTSVVFHCYGGWTQ
jgi:hypothetical protein